MQYLFKQFEAWVTPFKSNPFSLARIKLTGSYLLASVFMVSAITWAVYEIFIATIKNNIEYKIIVLTYGSEAGTQFIAAVSSHLLNILLLVDLVAVVFVTGFGFLFASRTLAPVKYALEKEKRFIADAAHELRTPLAVMKTGIETLPNDTLSKKEVQEFKKDMVEEVTSLIETTNDLLTLHKEDMATGYVPHKEEILFSDIARTQAQQFTAYAKNKHISYSYTIEPSIYVLLTKDAANRIVRNLIKNALDYTQDGGVVAVRLKKNDKEVVFEVTDTGVGITTKDQQLIFNRFYTVSDTHPHTHGAGLGLSVVQEIVKNAQGTISVESEVGVGSTFRVVLTIAKNPHSER